jgi:hypothetical protein
LMLLLDQRLCLSIEACVISVGGGKMLCASWDLSPYTLVP